MIILFYNYFWAVSIIIIFFSSSLNVYIPLLFLIFLDFSNCNFLFPQGAPIHGLKTNLVAPASASTSTSQMPVCYLCGIENVIIFCFLILNVEKIKALIVSVLRFIDYKIRAACNLYASHTSVVFLLWIEKRKFLKSHTMPFLFVVLIYYFIILLFNKNIVLGFRFFCSISLIC